MKRAMDKNDLIQAVMHWLGDNAPQAYAMCLAIGIALTKAASEDGIDSKDMWGAILSGLLTLALYPLLEYLGIPSTLAIFGGALIAFIGAKKLEGYVNEVAAVLVESVKAAIKSFRWPWSAKNESDRPD
jgi:lambda family phage holin